MTDYIKKQDAYRIALHDGGPVCAEKIAQLEPLKIDLKPATLNPKTVTWSGVDLGELKKACEMVGTVRVKSSINGEWTSMPLDEFFRMLGNKRMMEGKKWPEH